MITAGRQQVPGGAADHFGRLVFFSDIDGPASGALTQEQRGQHPTQPGLIADLGHGTCFEV